jgi:hypothetical protein
MMVFLYFDETDVSRRFMVFVRSSRYLLPYWIEITYFIIDSSYWSSSEKKVYSFINDCTYFAPYQSTSCSFLWCFLCVLKYNFSTVGAPKDIGLVSSHQASSNIAEIIEHNFAFHSSQLQKLIRAYKNFIHTFTASIWFLSMHLSWK